MDDPINDGGPAFPPTFGLSGEIGDGMSLRDWFAGQALLTVSVNVWIEGLDYQSNGRNCAAAAYALADAMIAARSAK
jgi:hypothetical protein